MTGRLRVALALVMTAAFFCGFLVWDPFAFLRDLFAKTGPGRDEARVNDVYTDPETQEVTHGEHPLTGLTQLEASWRNVPREDRYILTGNSQTYAMLLSPSEALSTQAERTYPDLLLERLQARRADLRGYRLSAPNISYMEVLWYLEYVIAHPSLIPGEFVVQLNFETFRKTAVREGMQELLADPGFAMLIAGEARSAKPYAGAFQLAIDQYNQHIAQRKGGGNDGANSRTGVARARGTGSAIETSFRAVLDRQPAFHSRGWLKVEFLDFLYLARVRLLGITPTTKRSLGGGTLAMNVSSLERIGELCKKNGIRLVFFNAPQNPNAPLYLTSADRDRYRGMIVQLARDYASDYYDFENSIPGPMWGVWIDGPDPIHFGRAAHRRFADLMFDRGVIDLGM
jgi:hypothetical protein